jgi:hypothetical protein
MFLILVASNAMDGTYLDYRPPTFQVWEAGVWERGTWGMNDEWAPASGGGGLVADMFTRRRRRGWTPKV